MENRIKALCLEIKENLELDKMLTFDFAYDKIKETQIENTINQLMSTFNLSRDKAEEYVNFIKSKENDNRRDV